MLDFFLMIGDMLVDNDVKNNIRNSFIISSSLMTCVCVCVNILGRMKHNTRRNSNLLNVSMYEKNKSMN